MNDTYSALTIARCSDCDVPLTWQLDGNLDALCALCDRLRTRAAIRRHLDEAATDRARQTTIRLVGDLIGCPAAADAAVRAALAPLGEGLSHHGATGTPDPFGSVPVLSPRNLGAHRARGTAPAAGGAL